MPTTDHPLKVLVLRFSYDFAEWLLGTDVISVEPINVELATEALRVDTLLRVVQADGVVVLLHIEFQGRRSPLAMELRELGYLSQLVIRHGIDTKIHSFVLYTERYAGQDDKGNYNIEDGHGNLSLEWRYTPILLWQMSGEELLKTGRPALLPLASLTRVDVLQEFLPRIVTAVRQQADEEIRIRLFNSLLALAGDEEVLEMIENLLANEEYDFETPYLRRWREKGLAEGLAEGRAEGRAQGRAQGQAEGQAKGRAEGQLGGLRQAILTLTASRFDPPLSKAQLLEKYINHTSEEDKLQALIAQLAIADSFDAVLAQLPNEAESKEV